MNIHVHVVAATAAAALTLPALAGGGFRAQGHSTTAPPTQLQQPRHHGDPGGAPSQLETRRFQSQAHARSVGSRMDPRPDPNYQNPYRPMYSLDATNPGEPHPYFRTRKDGFGYPAGPARAFVGNGLYVIPR